MRSWRLFHERGIPHLGHSHPYGHGAAPRPRGDIRRTRAGRLPYGRLRPAGRHEHRNGQVLHARHFRSRPALHSLRQDLLRLRGIVMRYAVVFALFVLSMITYIDRACIATAKDPISLDLALSDRAMEIGRAHV